MSLTPQTITLDLNPSFTQMQTVHCSQYDDNIRQIIVKLQDGGTDIDVSSYTIYIEGTKPDKHGFSYPLTEIGSVSGNTVTFYIQLQMCAVPGMTRAEVVLKSGTDRIGSANFMLAVERAGLQDDTNTSDSELAPYINGAETAAQEAAQSASDAEAWAVGQRNGADVDSSDVTYHNNSKYYSDQVSGALPAIQAEIDAVDDRVDGLSLDYYEETNPITHQRTEIGISLTKDGQYTDVAIWGTNSTIPEATTSKNGWMSATDKTDLTNAKANVTDIQGRVTTLEGEMDTAQEDLSAVKSAFEEFPTGIYPDMAVGSLMSEEYTEDKTPYLYRVSGGGVKVGKVENDTIVGGSVAWNQLCDVSTTTLVKASQRTKALPLTAGTTIISGHKYLIGAKYSALTDITKVVSVAVYTRVGTSNVIAFQITSATEGNIYAIRSSAYSGTATGATTPTDKNIWVYEAIDSTEPEDTATATISDVMLIDLTQMFGTTVADYLYSLETATAGAGVAWFRKLFPKPYYAYNAGELMHVSGVSEHKTVGKNLLPSISASETKNGVTATLRPDGSIWFHGQASANAVWDLARNVLILPSGTYYSNITANNVTVTVFKLVDGTATAIKNGGGLFTLTEETSVFLRLSVSNGTSVNTVVYPQIEIGSTATAYEPYEKHTYPLDSSLTLRGIPKLDSANNLYYDGDEYSADGKVTRRYGIVDMGTLEWTLETNGFRGTLRTIKPDITNQILLCSKYSFSAEAKTDMPDKTIRGNSASTGDVFVKDSSYTDATTFKSAMSGVYLVYELATPTTETAEPYAEYQHVTNGGTEEYVSTGIVPVGHITKYPTDIVSKVDGLPSDFSTLIAPTEKGFTATRAYSVNQFMIINNQLYKATASIANGATITVGTNVTATTIADILTSLLNA